MARGHINERLHTEFADSGRAAGMGISYDHYDDESGYHPQPIDRGSVKLPSDCLTPKERAALSGEVRIIRKKEDEP